MCKLPDTEYNWVTCSICKVERFGMRKPEGLNLMSQIRGAKTQGWHVIMSKAFSGFSCKKCGPRTFLSPTGDEK